jgi:predicted nucleotidyltransferase
MLERDEEMLSLSDWRIANLFRRQLQKLVMPLDVRVFGSRARGDASPESDLDVYIELEEVTPELRTQISELAWAIGLDHDCVISTFVVTRDQLTYGPIGASPLLLAVMEEGQPV